VESVKAYLGQAV